MKSLGAIRENEQLSDFLFIKLVRVLKHDDRLIP